MKYKYLTAATLLVFASTAAAIGAPAGDRPGPYDDSIGMDRGGVLLAGTGAGDGFLGARPEQPIPTRNVTPDQPRFNINDVDFIKHNLPKVIDPINHGNLKTQVNSQYLGQDVLGSASSKSLDHAGFAALVSPNMGEATLLHAKLLKIGDYFAVDLYGDSMINYDASSIQGLVEPTDSAVYLSAAAIDNIIEHAVSEQGLAEVNRVETDGETVNLLNL